MTELPGVEAVAVIGAGTIGASWAVVFGRAELEVHVFDTDRARLERLADRVAAHLELLCRDASLEPATAAAVRRRVVPSEELADAVAGVHYVQEAVPEDLGLKRAVFADLDRLASPATILASSTSALPMTAISAELAHPERCLVVHPTNPPHLVPLVEVVPGKRTAPEVTAAVHAFMERVGQSPILCRKEISGFVLNRLQMALLREALYLVRDGVATVSDVDRCMTDGLGLRWAFLGPFGVEHTNGEGIEDDFRKFLEPIRALMADLCRPYDGPTEADVRQLSQDVREMFTAAPHEELLAYRDSMILALRALRRGHDAARAVAGDHERGRRG